MRKIQFLLLSIIGVIISHFADAQAPQAIPYQAVARNNAGTLFTNRLISLRFSVRDLSEVGTVIYKETQITMTNPLGLFTVNIGQGAPVTGNFNNINWEVNDKFIQVEVDTAGGSNYTNLGTHQLLSVPYALNAANGNWTKSGNDIFNSNSGNIGIGTTTPQAKFHVNGSTKLEGSLQLQNGTEENDNILKSDNVGNASWVNISSLETDPKVSPTNADRVPKWDGSALVDGIITDDGFNVGIGTSEPTAKLDVNGTTRTINFKMSTGAGVTKIFQSDATGNASWVLPSALGITGTNSGDVTLSAIGSSSNSNGASLIGQVLTLQPANASFGGIITTSSQTFSGVKTFSNDAAINGLTIGRGSGNFGTNAAVGASALNANTIGVQNAAFGSSLSSNTSGNSNTASGYHALNSNTTGNNNTALGQAALSTNTTGTNNCAIGSSANVGSANLSNATAIGANSTVNTSNSLVLGNGANVGIGTSSPTAKLDLIGAIKITDGSQGAGKVLTSTDTSGIASWQTPALGWLISGNAGLTSSNFLGTTDSRSLRIRTNNTERIIVDSLGKVGIGTSAPDRALTVDGNGSTTAVASFNNYGSVNNIEMKRASGTQAAPTQTSSASIVGRIFGMGHDELTGYQNIASVFFTTEATVTSTSAPGAVAFATSPTGSTTPVERMRIKNDGNVGIGTSSPLSVFEVSGSSGFKITKPGSGADTLDATASIWYYVNNGSITFPAASSCPNRVYTIVNRNVSSRTVSSYISVSGTTLTSIPANTSIEIISDGTNWLQLR